MLCATAHRQGNNQISPCASARSQGARPVQLHRPMAVFVWCSRNGAGLCHVPESCSLSAALRSSWSLQVPSLIGLGRATSCIVELFDQRAVASTGALESRHTQHDPRCPKRSLMPQGKYASAAHLTFRHGGTFLQERAYHESAAHFRRQALMVLANLPQHVRNS